ncbi:hypothetical protein NQZ79_g537 [Umbelopsis isabellina]|nr:hypothetical protein NQZ79_g537 [Umbelopsis isabellina]
MNPHALVVGDVDNDGDNEFVIGNLNGDLAIFKGDCSYGLPAYFCRGLGTNSVVCINAEGHAHIFDFPNSNLQDVTKKSMSMQTNNVLAVEEYLQHSRRGSDTATLHNFRNAMASAQNGHKSSRGKSQLGKGSDEEQLNMQYISPDHTVKVPVNVNKIIIADIDGDGLNEVVLARTDRILHSFEFKPPASEDSSKPATGPGTPSTSTSTSSASATVSTYTRQNPLAGKNIRSSFSNITQNTLKMAKERPLPPSRATTKEDFKEPSAISKISSGWAKRDKSKAADSVHPNDVMDDDAPTKPSQGATVIEKDMWIFDGQITSLSTTMHPNYPNEPLLLVAQPGNTFTIIDQKGDRYNPDFTRQYITNSHYRRSNDQVGELSTYQFDSPEISQRPPNASSAERRPVDIDNAMMAKIIDGEEYNEEMYGLSVTPKARQFMTEDTPMAKSRRSTSGTIRPMLRRASSTHAIGPELADKSKTSQVQTPPVEIKSSSYVVQSWPLVDGDDVVGDEIKGLVATEIVMGKRRHRRRSLDDSEYQVIDSVQADVVGMLSMDGKFTIHNLLTKERSEYDLFVTHKLFSLATLNTSSKPLTLPNGGHTIRPSGNRSGMSTPGFSSHASSPQLKFPSPYMKPTRYNSSTTTSIADLSSAPSPAATPSRSVSENGDSDMEDNRSLTQMPSHDEPGTTMGTTISRIFGIVSGGQGDGEASEADGDDELDFSDSEQNGSRRGSEYNGLEDSWISEAKVEIDNDLFVACAWNGVTYMIDWSQTNSNDQKYTSGTKFQLVKFAFEGRVCAFTAGSYAVLPGQNVPCLFYVDFDDQIYVYYDVHITPGPVTGFLDEPDDDIDEALDRIAACENSIKELQQRVKDPDDNEGVYQENPFGNVIFATNNYRNEKADTIHRSLYDLPQLRAALSFELEQLVLAQTPFQAAHPKRGRRLSDIEIFLDPSLERDGAALSDGVVHTPSSITSPVPTTTPPDLVDRDHELMTDSDLADTEPDDDSVRDIQPVSTVTTTDTLS